MKKIYSAMIQYFGDAEDYVVITAIDEDNKSIVLIEGKSHPDYARFYTALSELLEDAQTLTLQQTETIYDLCRSR